MEAIFEEEKRKPLTVEVEQAKNIIFDAVNRAGKQCGLPAFILEGVLAEVQLQIKSQAKIELMKDYELYLEEIQKDKQN